ncbi:MAG: Ribonuclease 3 [Candidatus Daviesbacteria bacterium GW2011_GWA1_41_61]|uniref:Ribonuclease 3 n=1 Tax=Candidatus Daviesbacteria bacterium GW2011_GWA2_40_9 TaxID=1618424 RepID=A0A0G0X853_9BACT|nr:MAG: ribonuclease III, ribonuclease III [Candidatus Daviesbacteria bacterium GW2011_GWC1_40_9]KKR83837.1 MAG: Ribonuclease 3 [Candidatus Daviesbacteria bacterium GW2011_GWA2_40_9]KKR93446.1 MAG: Ribonuclease 3 [Candidatus Daviesbacteria bacterium GW2011_GWB1_41_15]KKS15005.1 MAG: Ribonuclease 3 [Candidatus Daviesbacteria bacterium GW2011_GWA1_41_61]
MNIEFRKILEGYGLRPQKEAFYRTAFTHRSFLNEVKVAIESNERLEFLGDVVLSFIISSYLFEIRPQDKEGDLTNLRAYIVKTDSLARVAKQLNLGHYLKLSRGEELSGGRDNSQLLANTYEALLGAIFLDLGLEPTRKFVEATLLPLFVQEVEKGAPRDPKSQLQEVAQNKLQTSPKYKILQTSGPDHAKQFTVGVFVQGEQIGQGAGSSKQQAEEEAAKEALIKLTK